MQAVLKTVKKHIFLEKLKKKFDFKVIKVSKVIERVDFESVFLLSCNNKMSGQVPLPAMKPNQGISESLSEILSLEYQHFATSFSANVADW